MRTSKQHSGSRGHYIVFKYKISCRKPRKRSQKKNAIRYQTPTESNRIQSSLIYMSCNWYIYYYLSLWRIKVVYKDNCLVWINYKIFRLDSSILFDTRDQPGWWIRAFDNCVRSNHAVVFDKCIGSGLGHDLDDRIFSIERNEFYNLDLSLQSKKWMNVNIACFLDSQY